MLVQEFILIGCMGLEGMGGDGLLHRIASHRIASNLFGLCLIPGYALCEGTNVILTQLLHKSTFLVRMYD
jgi:hypothetical protein